jgi:hypothetical protein
VRNPTRLAIAALVVAALTGGAAGAVRKAAEGRASNRLVEVTAKVFLNKPDIRSVVGAELEDVIGVVEVRLSPRPGVKLTVVRDDFELWSAKNGRRSRPFAPSQIAGQAVLMVSTQGAGGGVATDSGGTIWRPPVGDGRPRRMGPENASVGNVGSTGENTVQAGRDAGGKSTLALLEEKILPEKELTGPAAGLLYFYLEGKHKPKNVSLHYQTPAGPLVVQFK